MQNILTVDFGSTFTKLTAIDLPKREIIATARAFTTIEENVMLGFNSAFKKLNEKCGDLIYDKTLGASSAAGGLKMISVGLVPDLTAKASRLAAASAGAKVIKTYSYELSVSEVLEICGFNPDIILLSGGIDGGNKEIIIKNARSLASADADFAVIAAGNKAAADEIFTILTKGGKNTVICENVMPAFNKLNIEPARKAIRDLFIKNIITAKGLDDAQAKMSMEIIPTPLAVYNAAALLSQGWGNEKGLGALMIYDVGGATTDVCSMADGAPKKPNVFMEGLTEPYAKRTVEGDIGVRYSITHLALEAGVPDIAAYAGVTGGEVDEWIGKCINNPGLVAEKNTPQRAIDEALAAFAVGISAKRHAGYTEKTYTAIGEVFLQTGKDLTDVNYIIGTGGSVINSQSPKAILQKAAYSLSDPFCLKPVNPDYLIDAEYCFSSMGLLCAVEPLAALDIMKKGLKKI